jgi:hypothetical protein
MVALAGFLSYFYQAQRSARSQQFYKQGNELMAGARYQEAVERYRSALSSVCDRPASYGDGTETNISLAEQMWKARLDLCGLPSDEWLTRLMGRLSR